METQKTFKTQVEEYLAYCRKGNRSEHYLVNANSSFSSYIKRFGDKLEEGKLDQFLERTDRGLPRKETSANAILERFKSLAKFHNLELAKVPSRTETQEEVVAFTSESFCEFEAKLSTVKLESGTNLAAVARLLVETGLRVSEFKQLQNDSLKESRGAHVVKVLGKGRKWRTVTMSDAAIKAFDKINFPIPDSLRYLNQKFAEASIGIEGIDGKAHFHMLRATYASISINEKNIPPMLIAKEGGWTNIEVLAKHYRATNHGAMAQALNQQVKPAYTYGAI